MMTPFQRQRERQRAEQQAAELRARPAGDVMHESQHIRLLALEQDLKRLHDIELIADKKAFKRDTLLPRWLPHVRDYLDRGRVYQNPVFVYCVIWLFDTGQFEPALQWADIAVAQGQKTPERFRSGLPTFVAHFILEWAEGEAERGNGYEPYFSQVFDRIRHTWQVNERLTARYYRFAGLQLLRNGGDRPQASAVSDPEVLMQADELLASAEALHPRIQVKTHRQRIAMRLRALLAA
ncbi:TPA: terminase [Escherichia coli]|nr:terminase [Escherichia coli]HBA7227627.1 terminase [Escherichia coli]HBA8150466.1 terminase [Escherichia coli]